MDTVRGRLVVDDDNFEAMKAAAYASLNIGVNCAQKEMKVRFWEGEDVIYHAKF